jgi:hypothetical protein
MPDSMKESLPSELRGADAHWFGSIPGQLRLYTGNVTITIMADDRDLALAAANGLRSVTPGLGVQSAEQELGPVTDICGPLSANPPTPP